MNDVRGMKKKRVDAIRTARALKALDEIARDHPEAFRPGSAADVASSARYRPGHEENGPAAER